MHFSQQIYTLDPTCESPEILFLQRHKKAADDDKHSLQEGTAGQGRSFYVGL